MDREFLIGVEVNSKTITAGLVDLGGKIVKRVILPTELSKGKAKTVENIASAINKVKKNKILGVGVSLPGIINREKGIVVESPFPGWNGIMLKKSIEDAVKIPVFIENEGRCFAIAEYKCGIFKKTDNSISVLFNDRISAGIMIDGKLAKGASFAAGLVSHSVVDNKKMTLDEQASPASIERQFKERTKKSKSISEIILLNDKVSKEILTSAGVSFGNTMAHLVNALNPELIIVGGPLARSESFLNAAETAIAGKTHETTGKRVKLIGSKMHDSTILGAASIVI